MATPNSLEDLQNRGVIPAFIPEDELIEICRKWGIAANDLSYVLNNAQLKGLLNDLKIQNAIRNQNEIKKYNKKANDIQRLIDKYERLKTSKAAILNSEEINRIDDLISKLNDQKTKALNESNKIEYDSINSHFQVNGKTTIGGRIDAGLAKINGDIAERYNDKIVDAYKEFNNVIKEKNSAHSKFRKRIADHKIRKITNRIYKLKHKQGKFVGNQNKLINKHSQKFIDRMTKRQEKLNTEQYRLNEQIRNIEIIERERKALQKENANIEVDINNTNTAHLSGRLERDALRISRAINERRINELKRKRGQCDRRIQHKVVLGRGL